MHNAKCKMLNFVPRSLTKTAFFPPTFEFFEKYALSLLTAF